MESHDCIFKLSILGENTAEKSKFFQSLDGPSLGEDTKEMIGIDFKIKTFVLNNIEIKLLIWNNSGQERFINVMKSFFRGINGVILMYSITDKNSFISLINRYKNCYKLVIDENNLEVILMGTNSEKELSRQVFKHEAETFAFMNDMLFFEVSVLNYTNIDESLKELIKEMLINPSAKKNKAKQAIILHKKPKNEQNGNNCL